MDHVADVPRWAEEPSLPRELLTALPFARAPGTPTSPLVTVARSQSPPAGRQPTGAGAERRPTSSAVREALARDPVILEAVSRGVVNMRALARYIIEREGWDSTEEAVLSALRRVLRGRPPSDRVSEARAVLAAATVRTRSRQAGYLIPRSRKAYALLGEARQALEARHGDLPLLMETPQGLFLVMAESEAQALQKAFHEVGLRDTIRGITVLEVTLPNARKDHATSFALLCSALASEDVALLGAWTGGTHQFFLFPDRDTLRAYDAVERCLRPVSLSGERAADR